MSNPRTFASLGAIAGLVAVCTLPAANAATPSGGTVNETTPVTWDGATGMPPTADSSCGGPSNSACDNFALTVVPPSPAYGAYAVTVSLQPLGGDDWDLEVYDPSGNLLGSSGNSPAQLEVIVLDNPPAGVYTVAASPFAGPTGYTATAAMQPLNSGTAVQGSEQVEFYTYLNSFGYDSGEPSGGINWNSETGDNGGTIMYVSGLDTLRIRLNDCVAPATYLTGGNWRNVSPPNAVTSLDPIGAGDPITGRFFSCQLTGQDSLTSWTDDDGDSWTPSQGGGIVSGVDHQTMGGGRDAEPLYSILDGNNPAYNNFAHAVYYCSQDVADALCAVSLADGGTTFQGPTPIYTLLDCGGLHGHVKVSPLDGAAYVPNKGCNGEQGGSVSLDNGATWNVFTIPNSGTGDSDPSIGIASDGTVYMGMDWNGKPRVAISHDHGTTWSDVVDVSFNLGIQSVAFPEMVAGDPDRAAFAWLGSHSAGAVGTTTTNPPQVWHLYVSMTFDGGASWTTVNVTNPDGEMDVNGNEAGDVVQRGPVCLQGTTCPSNRNLLDFNDIQMDKRGRPVVIFAKGCIGNCLTNPGTVTQAARSIIARLKSPMGLVASYDAERTGVPDWPQGTATRVGSDVQLDWLEPGDGGNAIDGYHITKNGTTTIDVGPNVFTYTDVGGSDTDTYTVEAHNSEGYSRLKAGCSNVLSVQPLVTPEHGCSATGANIPDGQPNNPLEESIVLDDLGTITDLNVSLQISHTWVGDLTVTLTHEDTGTSATLMSDLLAGQCQFSDVDATFDDEAIQPVSTACTPLTPSVSGDLIPEDALSAFDGEDIAGTWTLSASDSASSDSGTLTGWCLVPEVEIPDTDGDGLTDDVDNCPAIQNAGQEDGDSDGVGDVCDNCTERANTDQCDTNGDGYGNVCDPDINNNGVVNFVDLNMFKQAFEKPEGDPNWNPDADFTCNGVVNTSDLAIMKQMFYGPPGPSALAP